MLSPDLRSEVARVVDPKEAPRPRREKSRDVMTTLEARLAKMELTVADKLEAYDERIEKLESMGDELQEEMQSALNSAVDMLQQDDTFLREENAVLQNHVEVLLKELTELKERIDQHDVALATRGMVSHPFMTKDMPKPKPYKGSRNAREIDYFLWSMEVYFNAAGFRDDASKIQAVPLYLEGIATLWWRRRCEDMKNDTCSINT